MSDWITDYYADVDGMRLHPVVDRHTDDAEVRFANFPPAVGKQAIGEAIGGFWSMIGGVRHERRTLWLVNDGRTAVLEALLHHTTKGGARVALPCVSPRPRRGRPGLRAAGPHRPGAAVRVHRGRGRPRTCVVTGRHDGRVAVITGGAGGIGRAYALRLAREGAAVAVLDRADAADVVAQVEQGGGTAIAVRTDSPTPRPWSPPRRRSPPGSGPRPFWSTTPASTRTSPSRR
jgi:hypothetical protein